LEIFRSFKDSASSIVKPRVTIRLCNSLTTLSLTSKKDHHYNEGRQSLPFNLDTTLRFRNLKSTSPSTMDSRLIPGESPPKYDDLMRSRSNGTRRHVQSSMPWWNPRYWRKRIWAGLVAVIVIIIIIVVAVVATKSKSGAYPTYAQVSYSLKETCKLSEKR
jgi:hypothetical protein